MRGWVPLGRGVWRMSKSVADGAASGLARASEEIALTRASRGPRRGVLSPGDPDPPPTAPTDYYDYRGVARGSDLCQLEGAPFPLGRLVDPRRGHRFKLGLPFDVLRRHAAVIGPTGGGKTKGLIVPWVAAALRLGHCVIAVDIAGDLLEDLARHRSATGALNAEVAQWDLSKPRDSISWSWLKSLTDDEAVDAAVEALQGRQPPNDPQPFFHQRDGRFLKGLLQLAQADQPTATGSDILGIVRNPAALESLIDRQPSHPATARLLDLYGRSYSDYSQATSGLVNALEVLEHGGLKSITSRDELQIDQLFDSPRLLVVGAPLHAGKIGVAASSLLLSQVINRLYRRFTHDRGQHVFLVLDEAARLADRLRLEELLSVSRRARVSVVLAAQDVAQFKDASERISLFGNCATYVSLPGRSTVSAEYLQSRLGQRYQSSMSISRSGAQLRDLPTKSSQVSLIDVLGVREILDPPWGPRSAIVHSQPIVSKPFVVDLSRPEFS